jgi:hypothetical protein
MARAPLDSAPDNSTFAQRAAARGALKQVTPDQVANKAITDVEPDTAADVTPAKARTK